MALGDNIRRIRTAKGMTIGELSNATGVKIGQISKIERNESDTKISTIYKIMEALECSADSIFLDMERTGMKGIIREVFEVAAKLPEDDQGVIVKIVEKFAMANGLASIIDQHRILINDKKSPATPKSILQE